MKKVLRNAWRFLKCLLGMGSVEDGSICWFSAKYFDVHDYHESRGGDGYPSHFYAYHCSRCGKAFGI